MEKEIVKLQVFFEDPFWIGILEKVSDGKLNVTKITFGAEPKDYEVQKYLMKNWFQLRFSPAIEAEMSEKDRLNPKRLQRDVKRQLLSARIGTKSQQALKLQQEQNKAERKNRIHKKSEEEKEQNFERRQQKRKEKHRGR
ncbi:YjdF family protein [Anaeromicropila populeti]|uniref:DUF2992 family protein n=1 Tax=Anaeromicropila populeti TaxID=37658 RepID=A0A1I6JMN4_9FIRM|nr:YjdF family protein [Anaeromicropila populeti]SFR80214.1 Protein of unknown function [Anaeromicropila populeti]